VSGKFRRCELFGRASRAGFLLLILPALPGAAQTEAAESDPLAGRGGLERSVLVRTVLERNPSLEAARQAWRAAAARPAQEEALEDPTISYGIAPLSIGSRDVDFGQELRVEQALPYPGLRALRRARAEAEAEAVLSDYRTALLELAATAALLFEDYRLVDRAIAINQEHLQLLRDVQEVAAARYAAGLASQQDPIQAEVEGTELLQRGVELAGEREELAARINALLHRRPGLPLPSPAAGAVEPGPDLASPEALEEAAIAARPEVAGRLAERRARRSGVDLARRERRPEFAVMGSFNSMWTDAEHRWMVGAVVSLPLWRGRLDAAEAEAQARLAQAESDFDHLETEIRADVRARFARLAEARRRIELFKDRLLPAVRDSIQAARAAFETGQSSFLTVIDAERGLRRAELGYEQAVADLRRRQVQLDRAVGRLPEGSHPDFPSPAAPGTVGPVGTVARGGER
jgi:cobalt-zinc-cadmium efflux system outer membrane protein